MRIQFEYEVFNENKELLNVGETTLVFVDMKSGRPIPLPENILSKLEDYY